MTTPTICIATGSRSEYGLLLPLIRRLRQEQAFRVRLLVFGMHCSTEFGLTYKFIKEDGIPIFWKAETLLAADTPTAAIKSMGLAQISLADALERASPHLLVLLGDRYEILAAACAATVAGIPIAHIHGGEVTEGAFDDAIRHAISKMAYLHFTSAEAYRRRVMQMGEDASRVFTVGALGLDAIRQIPGASRDSLEKRLGVRLRRRNLLVAFHPVTWDERPSHQQFQEVLRAIDPLPDTFLIFTRANADPAGRRINALTDSFVADRADRTAAFASLGQELFISTLREVDGIVGNSSSGIIEAPFLRVGTVNVGDRQKGRLCGPTIINCPARSDSIRRAIARLYAPGYAENLRTAESLYGDGRTSERIVRVLKRMRFPLRARKRFVDI